MKIPAQQNGNPLAACYCSQLDKALSEVNYAKPLKRQFLSQMQDSLCNYLEAHPDARLEDLYAAFGTPQEAADSALLNTDSDQIKKQLKTSQLFHFLFAVVIAILVMVVVYRLGALAINRYVSQPYIIESPATVITGPLFLPTDNTLISDKTLIIKGERRQWRKPRVLCFFWQRAAAAGSLFCYFTFSGISAAER